MFMKGQRVYVEGDAPAICTADYTCRIASWATVVDDFSPSDDYICLSIDKVGGDRHARVYVLKGSIRLTDT